MTNARTGFMTTRSKVLEETTEHLSRLSIRCTTSGEQHYKVGGNDHLVTKNNYLLINRGQNYKTSFESDIDQEMELVAFQPGFAEDLYYSLNKSSGALLDDPFNTWNQQVTFFEHTYDMDPIIKTIFDRLRNITLLDDVIKKEMDIESIYTALLTRMFETQHNIRTELAKLPSAKLSTRKELFRRLNIARDYMEAHIDNKLTLEDISRISCLSLHHFRREFRSLFGCSPHAFLLAKRVDRARNLLNNPHINVIDVALACGFENASSFIRIFKQYTGHTPGSYKTQQLTR